MGLFESAAFADHEDVHFFSDPEASLRAIIAIHSTSLGPAAGGVRFWMYESSSAALTDALRLSRGMSYKSAMAGLPLGGGKAVVMKPEISYDRERLFLAFGRAVERLGGRYITAEDVGMTVADMDTIGRVTNYVAGRSGGSPGSGDPSPKTADGVFLAIRVAAKRKLGRSDLQGLRVAVQGVGHVGYKTCKLLHDAGAKLVVSDIDHTALQSAEAEFGARVVSPDAIYDQDAEVFSPCALGATLNAVTLPRLRAKVIAGAANNQLADDSIGEELMRRGILYAPDYVANGGGIINVAAEVSGSYDPRWVDQKVAGLGATLDEVFARSELEGRPPSFVADEIARERIAKGR